MGLSLIAFDTDHVKRYVFGTNKLKEIRGASSRLDFLNRIKMTQIAEKDYQARTVYANGGSGLFVIETSRAESFGKRVQRAYREETGGGASITFVWEALPNDVKEMSDVYDITIQDTLELLRWRLQEEKMHPPARLPLTTHPFLRLCDACGIEYADASDGSTSTPRDPDENDAQYCTSCALKRARDSEVKDIIKIIEATQRASEQEYLWNKIIARLRELGYSLPKQTERPADFNVFRNFKGAKDYLGLIYADANNMGRHVENQQTLSELKTLATTVDEALFEAVCTAITRHLKIADHLKLKEQVENDSTSTIFPFDILLLGGDDICMVVPASVAMDVALALAETFRSQTNQVHSLSASVVLAPIKYPFGLLQEMAETALKFAKKVGGDARAQAQRTGFPSDDTRINFLLVTGGSSSDFKSVYEGTYHKEDDDDPYIHRDFYATLRPYAPEGLHLLLKSIRDKDGANLGRTKLHQMREAIFQMNLTTSVSESLAVLRNWRAKQREHILQRVYTFAGQHQMPHSDPTDLVSGFPTVTFPWFADGKNKSGDDIYRTPLIDFIELYDFLSREGGDDIDKD